jgi:hypothetical protein
MPFAPTAAAVVGAGVGLIGSKLQADAVKDASGNAIDAQREARDQARADLAPWTATGGTANTATTDILGLNGPDAATAARGRFQTSPGYQWSLDQGLRAIDAGAASTGMLRSGATVKAEQTFGTGLADQEFKDYYNRLFDLSKLGESAAAGSASASTTAGAGIASTDLSQGSALSSIYGNAAQGVGNAVNTGLNNYTYLNRLSPGADGTLTSYPNPAGGAPYYSSSNPGANWTV